jgi:O-succinylbenzoate synthase
MIDDTHLDAPVGVVDEIQLLVIAQPLVKPFGSAAGAIDTRTSLLVRIASGGLTGWGECVAFERPWYSAETIETAWHVIRDFLGPAVVDSPAASVAVLVERFELVRGHAMAKAAVENALLDLLAKRSVVPLGVALGGQSMPIQSGISLGLNDSHEQLIAAVAAAVDRRYRRVKLKIAPGRDVEVTRAVRARFPDLALSVDGNGAYTRADFDVLKALDEFGLEMIEQPLAGDDLVGHSELQRLLATPICLDESITGQGAARTALELGACRVVNIKQGRVGGLLVARAIAALCQQHGVPAWSGGMLETGIGRAANLQLQTLPGFTLPGDTSETSRYFAEDIVEPPVVLDQGGLITLPPGAGIGVEVLEDRVAARTIRRLTLAQR